jgi:hypothetical protein
MIALNWLTGRFSNRGRALSRFRRASVRAQKNDHQGAIDDYTATIGMQDTAADVKAMALYNRGLVHVATGDGQKGVDDFDRGGHAPAGEAAGGRSLSRWTGRVGRIAASARMCASSTSISV